MPVYEYKCPHCQNKFEKKQPMNKRRDTRCPNCNHKAYLVLSLFNFSMEWRLDSLIDDVPHRAHDHYI